MIGVLLLASTELTAALIAVGVTAATLAVVLLGSRLSKRSQAGTEERTADLLRDLESRMEQMGLELSTALEMLEVDGTQALMATGDTLISSSIPQLVAREKQLKIPGIWSEPGFPYNGSLMSYGPDHVELQYGAAEYTSRILRGEKPGELPVQAPTKFQLVINVKTAKALGLRIPEGFLIRADEVIE